MVSIEYIRESAEAIRQRIGDRAPEALMILGSGLGGMAELIKDEIQIPYREIPHFSQSTAPGHSGRLVCGELGGKQVLVMDGRVHYYEGYCFEQVVLPVQAARLLGVRTLVVTNASGGINRNYQPGDLMLIADHIKLCGDSPLRGENADGLGVRFPDMTYVYTPRLRQIARDSARKLGMELKEGIYYYAMGPQYETPAEIRAMGILGADAVGMSTAPEAIAAAHAGMEVLGISLIANMASGILDQPLTCEEVIEAGEKAKDKFGALVLKCLENL